MQWISCVKMCARTSDPLLWQTTCCPLSCQLMLWDKRQCVLLVSEGPGPFHPRNSHAGSGPSSLGSNCLAFPTYRDVPPEYLNGSTIWEFTSYVGSGLSNPQSTCSRQLCSVGCSKLLVLLCHKVNRCLLYGGTNIYRLHCNHRFAVFVAQHRVLMPVFLAFVLP